MERRPRNERGQALVELVLGLLLFITVLVFGIHFAEVSYLSMRVQQSAHNALFGASGLQAHQVILEPNNPSAHLRNLPGLATANTQRAFRDFDAVRGGNATSVQQVLTQIQGLDVTCRREDSITFPQRNIDVVSQVFWAQGGIRCGADATVGIFNFPRNFFDGNWNFSNRNYAGQQTSYRICATPRAANGDCGDFGMLVGDWSLQGVGESGSHDLYNGGNTAFANAAEAVFNIHGGGGCPNTVAFAQDITGSASPDACGFTMSYMGVENGYMQNIGGVDVGPTTWNTGGADTLRALMPNVTYLGVPASRRF